MNGNKNKRLRHALLGTLLSLGFACTQAEDIDLFNVTNNGGSDPKPNVLFVLDNSANWDFPLFTDPDGNKISKKDAIHAALYRLAADSTWGTKIRMGIMTLANSNTPKGGRLLHAIGDLNASAYSRDWSTYRYNRYRLLDKIWGEGITRSYVSPTNPSKTITDTGVPSYQWWCNEWVSVDWNRYNKVLKYDSVTGNYYETGVGQENSDSDWVIKRDVDGDGVMEAGNDCFIPAPFYIAYNIGYGNVVTDPTTNTVSLDGYPTWTLWDYDYSTQIHYYLDPVDVDMVTWTGDSQWLTLPPTYESDPSLVYLSDATGEMTTAKLSEITVVGSGPRIPKTNNRPFALTLHEAYLYLNGGQVRSGLGDGWYDAATNKGADDWWFWDAKSSSWTSAFSNSTAYQSPINDDNACARNFIIFIGSGNPDANEDGDAETLLRGLNGVLSSDPIPLTPSNYESNWSDEYTRMMYAKDFTDTQTENQNVSTFVIDVFDPAAVNTDPERAARSLLQSIATQGRGKYFTANNADAIYQAMRDALLNILADNTVFASTTLPVSVNVRGTNLNQVYMGVFRPDESWQPRWMGNLKLYQLALDANNNVFLADANGNKAQDSISGFIVGDGESYWTFNESNDFWSFPGTPYPNSTDKPTNTSDLPDGKDVEKGAAAQRTRKDVIEHAAGGGSYDTSRNLFTCDDLACSNVVDFNDTNAGSRLDVISVDYTSSDLVDWIYGANNHHISDASEGTRAARASLHGDVLHSRPAVIGYNVNDENDVIAYYGANDGIFHAVKGGKTSDGNSLDGHERWGMIFPEFLPELKKLYDNTQINTDRTDPAYNPKPYFADGTIGILREPVSGNPTKVHLFVSMRRGGRLIYALDVSPTTPGTAPSGFNVLWKKSNADYPELGQTWSEPKVAKLKVGATSYKDVLIFGGGYDPDFDDVAPRDLANADSGRDIFVLDAADGSLIWQASAHIGNGVNNFVQEYPIPSDVTVIDLNGDGDVDRIYVGDTGGNVWRVNIDDVTTPADWAVDKLANVGADYKFLYPPDVVELDSSHLAIVLGSGNREDARNVLMAAGHRDRVYMFQDTRDGTVTGITEATMANVMNCDTVDLLGATPGGWYMILGDGEKVVTSAVTLNGTTFFSTNQITSSGLTSPISCTSDLGTAWGYKVNFRNPGICSNDPSAPNYFNPDNPDDPDNPDEPPQPPRDPKGPGFPPSPVPVIVELEGKKIEAVVSGTDVDQPPDAELEVRKRRYWFEESD